MRLFSILFALIVFVSCNECKECFLVEEVNGQRIETSIGEFCGDDIDEKESEVLITIDGEAFYECD